MLAVSQQNSGQFVQYYGRTYFQSTFRVCMQSLAQNQIHFIKLVKTE